MKSKLEQQIPEFNLQMHHAKVEVPRNFDMKDLAKKHQIFPLKVIAQNGKARLLLAMVNPFDQKAIADVEFRAGMTILPVRADRNDLQWLIQVHYFGRKLSPTAHVEPLDLHQDMFAQLEMTTDEQSKPEWMQEANLRAYASEEKQDEK